MNPAKLFIYFISILLVSAGLTFKKTNFRKLSDYETILDTLTLIDTERNRVIPVAFYKTKSEITNQKIVIFNHGYGGNEGGDYLAYSYLTKYLASKGYFVVSIQHELITDQPLAMEGNLRETRRSNWEMGVQNILFVINDLKKRKPDLDYKHLSLIGHSNGGDIIMLFAAKYPELADKIISLDNRRMPFPRIKKPEIYSLRSSDQLADDGVIPSNMEQTSLGMKILKLKDTQHNDMDNSGNSAQHKVINEYVLKFLNE